MVWVRKTVARQRTEEADPPYTIAVIEDITDRKEAEERQRVLLAELNHRVKNTLATIQSIATQIAALRPTPRSSWRGSSAAAVGLRRAQPAHRADVGGG